MKWLNLKDFGIEIKRVELSNKEAFPVILITDLEKYRQSGAMPLEALNTVNESGFLRFGGTRKGRDFNTPIYFLSSSLDENGVKSYKIGESVTKLLNIPRDHISKYTIDVNPADVVVVDAYGDFDRLNAAIQSASLAYTDNTIYLLKNQAPATSLQNLHERLSNSQHELFPKSNLENIPLALLSKFGYTSDIVKVAFLNPMDAKAQNYSLSDLEPLVVSSDSPILPVSLNSNGSINVITNLSNLSQLAYSSFKWEKNINLIHDYNSLVSLRESSRAILNARPSLVKDVAAMDAHLTNLSLVLQNFNESNTVAKTYKAIKYNNKGVVTYIAKNEEGEWRYIEKEGPKKTDLPLSFANYQKAVTNVANYNAILSSALKMEVKTGAEFNAAMKKVMDYHQQLYLNYVKEVDQLPENPSANRLYVNHSGIKVSNRLLKQLNDEFQRDMGENLYTEAVKSVLGGMRKIEDAGDINNLLGGTEVTFTDLAKSIQMIKSPAPAPIAEDVSAADIGLSILDSYKPDKAAPATPFKREAPVAAIQPETPVAATQPETPVAPLKAETPEVILLDKNAYRDLPKGMSDQITANYGELNTIYQTIQHIELSSIPWWKNAAKKVQEVNQANTDAVLDDYMGRMKTYLEKGGDQHTLEAISNLDHEQLQSMARIGGLTQEIETYIQKEHLKASILRYQFTRQLQGVSGNMYGILAFNSDQNNNYLPFDKRAEYQSAVQQLQNTFAAQNEDNNGLVPLVSDVRTKLDAFVNIHYATLSTPIEPSTDAVKIARENAVVHDFSAALPVVSDYVPPLNNEKLNQIGLEFWSDTMNGLGYVSSAKNHKEAHVKLDTILSATAKRLSAYSSQINGLPVLTDHPRINAIIERYNSFRVDEAVMGKEVVTSPSTGVPLSLASKVATLAYLHQSAQNLIAASGNIVPQDPSRQFSSKLAEAQNTITALNKGTQSTDYQETLAAQFLIQHQHGRVPADVDGKVFAIKIDARTSNYTVQAVDPQAQLKDMSVLSAKTYGGAVREAFITYQLNRVAEDLGISPAELALAGKAAEAAKAKNGAEFGKIMKDLTGSMIHLDDIPHARLKIGAKGENGNNDCAVLLKDAPAMSGDEYQATLMANKIALVAKLGGLESSLQASPLIQGLGDLGKFELVQKYLNPEVEEKALILKEQISLQAPLKNAALKSVANTVTDFAYRALLSKDFGELGLKNSALVVATNIPESDKDVLFSRVLKADWIHNTHLHYSKFNYNLSPIAADLSDKSALHNQIKRAVSEHMDSPDYVYLSPSIPKINPIRPSKDIDADLSPVLTEGAYWNTHLKDVKAQPQFAIMAARANFEHALRTAPVHVQDAINNFSIRGKRDLSQTISIAMTKQEGTQLPRMALAGKGDQLDSEFATLEVMSITQFMHLIKGDETKIRVSDQFKFEEENADLVKFHNGLLAKSGFDPVEFNKTIVESLKDTDNHQALVQKIPETVTIGAISNLYWSEVEQQIKDTKANTGKGIYVQVSSDTSFPTVKLVDSAAKPNTLDLSGVPKDLLPEFLTYKMVASNILLNPMIVDSLKPVAIPTPSISPSSLLVVRQNLLEQIMVNNKEQKSIDSEMAVFLVDTSVLLARSGKSTTEIALAATSERIKDLAAQGYDVITTNTPEQKLNNQVINPLGMFIRANYTDVMEGVKSRNSALNDILTQFVHIAHAEKRNEVEVEKPDEKPIPALSLFKDVEQAVEIVTKQQEIDMVVHAPTLIASEFADRFEEYDAEKIATMNVSKINKEITKDKLWQSAHIERHLAAGHQQLDALILGLSIRDALPNRPSIREDGDLQTAATGYSIMMKEVYDVVAGAKSVGDILTNFNKAYRKITAFDPDLLKNNDSGSEMMLGLKKAAYEYEQQGVPAGQALENNLKKHKGLMSAYEDVVMSAAQHEKLYSHEKSFIHYMNGFTLNAEAQEAAALSDALLSRLQSNRIASTFGFEKYESENSILHVNKKATIDARSAIDFDGTKASADLADKWGVTLKVSPADKHLEQGYINLADKFLTDIQKNTGLDGKAVGNNMSIFASHPSHLMSEKADLFIVGVDGNYENNYAFVANRWFGALLNKVEALEEQKMTQEEQIHFADLKVNNRGLVHMIAFENYQPKTEAAVQLAKVHEFLLKGQDDQQIDAMERIVANSLLLTKTKRAEFQESDPSRRGDEDFAYASFVVEDMRKKQAEALKAISEKMKAVAAKNPDADDLYPFMTLEKQYEKIIHVSVPSSDAMIKKYVAAKTFEDKAHQEAAVLEIKTALDNQSAVFTAAQDVLAANARHGILQLVQEHAPQTVLNHPDLEKIIKRDLGGVLGENLNATVDNEYKNEFAFNFIKSHAIQRIEYPDHYAEDYSNFKPVDLLVCDYLGRAINGEGVDDANKDPAQKFVATLAQEAYNAERKELDKAVRLKQDKVVENSASLDV